MAALFSQNDAFKKVNLPGLWDRLMKYASRRFILKKKLENIFYLFAYGVNDSSHLVVLIIFETIDVLMTVHDSRHIMRFVASVPFWFLAGKYALENSSIVCRLPL